MTPTTSIPVTAKLCLLKYTVQFINLLFKECLSTAEPQTRVTSHEEVGKIFWETYLFNRIFGTTGRSFLKHTWMKCQTKGWGRGIFPMPV